MKIHYILHADFEKLGMIESWAKENKHALTGTSLHKGDFLPNSVDEFDMIISMGGPQNLSEIHKHPELQDEFEYIKKSIEADKMILGICLGAQMISLVLGGSMVKCEEKEIGEFPLYLTENGKKDSIFSKFPSSFNAVHWHGEMTVLPKSCKALASTKICSAQAFSYNEKIYGLQFHLEFSPEAMQAMIENSEEDIEKGGPFVRSKHELKNTNFKKTNNYLQLVLGHFQKIHSKDV